MPKVTVIIPTYNRAETLPRAVDSALDQTFEDLEVLVVDDGSTDETRELLDSYSDPRVRTIAHETNRGANVARNTGIENARGEYVAFLDSDDEWYPGKVSRQLTALDAKGSDWIAAYCDTEIRTSGSSGRLRSLAAGVLARADVDPRMEGGEQLVGEILAGNVHPGAGSTLLVRTDVAREIGGFDETLDRFQDPEFVLQILDEGKVAYVDEPLVVRLETGTPAAETVAAADERYLRKNADAVETFERRGYDIMGRHHLILAKRYFEDGQFYHGTNHARRATVPPRHCPGLLWAVIAGVGRQDRKSLAIAASAVGLVVAAVAIRGSSNGR
ncbi:glycosyltransferase family 2 protein [Halostella sp. PRR32]|uniref:glycosyltransferase family 2 protein n=1 Tax=Halostella sp. PRR32 TaxID=3098147 RepID=UPI002B1CE65A|nr:glycosyltransferase family 2 protein [Halostella sp. PRR32]